MNAISTIEAVPTSLQAPPPQAAAANGDFNSMLEGLLAPDPSAAPALPPPAAPPALPLPEAAEPLPAKVSPQSLPETPQPEPTPVKLTTPVVPQEISGEIPLQLQHTGTFKNPESPAVKPRELSKTVSGNELLALLMPFMRPASSAPGFENLAQPASPLPQRWEAEPQVVAAAVTQQVATIEIQKESVAVARPMMEVKTPLVEIPTVVEQASMPGKFSQKDSGGSHDEQSSNAAQPEAAPVPVFTDAPARFDSNLATPEPSRPVAHVPEPLPQPAVLVAHRVSIDIGDAENRVTVVLHERAGEVSVKFHTASESMKAELQSSVGSLVEALHREQVPLANMDFTSGHAGDPDPDPEQQKEKQRQQAPRRPRPSEKFTLEPTDADSPAGIRILA